MQRAGRQSIAQLRAIPAADVLKLTAPPRPEPGAKRARPSIGFWPTVDGKTVTANAEQPNVNVVSKVPFMTGFTANEGISGPPPSTAAQFEAYVRDRYGAFAERLLAVYPHATQEEVAESAQVHARDRYMANLVFWVQGRTSANDVKIYTYMYDHPYPAANGVSFGAFHTSDVPFVMGALGKGERQFDKRDEEVSRSMQDQWLAFMKTGNPSVSDREWPAAATSDMPSRSGDCFK